jgi:glyoxylase-like metal-dependent hydrolase (beta-lactamase superfamily II)
MAHSDDRSDRNRRDWMSEPRTRAETLVTIGAGLDHWTILDERIDFRSEAYAVGHADGTVLIDPLPLSDELARSLEPVQAIVITGGFHQRACWTARRLYGAPVYAPAGADGLDEAPDESYEDGAILPGGLRALERPGPTNPHFALTLSLPGDTLVVFAADLLMRGADGPFAFVPDDHQDDPARSRDSVRRLLTLSPDTLCPAHGAPSIGSATARIREALDRDAKP